MKYLSQYTPKNSNFFVNKYRENILENDSRSILCDQNSPTKNLSNRKYIGMGTHDPKNLQSTQEITQSTKSNRDLRKSAVSSRFLQKISEKMIDITNKSVEKQNDILESKIDSKSNLENQSSANKQFFEKKEPLQKLYKDARKSNRNLKRYLSNLDPLNLPEKPKRGLIRFASVELPKIIQND